MNFSSGVSGDMSMHVAILKVPFAAALPFASVGPKQPTPPSGASPGLRGTSATGAKTGAIVSSDEMSSWAPSE